MSGPLPRPLRPESPVPEISVIVPHLNQPEALGACLAALSAQTLEPGRFEVIVVDNGSAALPVAALAAFPGVRLAAEPRPGPGPARNRGAGLARGGLLAFTDADCRPDPGWLAALVAGFAADPDAAVLGGRVEVVAAEPAAPTPAEGFDIVYGLRQDRQVARGFAATANLAVRRAVFEAVGPFAGIALAEDMDWCRRAATRGWPARYVPEAAVRHPARPSFAALARQWDRHIGHAWAALPPGPAARLRWLFRAAAVAASPLAEVGPLLATRRLAGPRQRLGALAVLVRIRLYRARRMLQALVADEARRGSLGSNRLLDRARNTPERGLPPRGGGDFCRAPGEVAEWSKAHAWKVCRRETVSRVRIPLSPPFAQKFAELREDTLSLEKHVTGIAMMLSRRTGAQRLLDEAIRLWLDAREPLAVHALTMAGFRVLYDLHKHDNSDQHSQLEGLLTKVGFSRLYDLANKLKHADRDAEAQLIVPCDKENEWRIGMALVIYRTLESNLTAEMGAFHLMSLSAYPDTFQVAANEDPDIEASAQLAASLLRADVEHRRTMVRIFLKLIGDGVLPANINLRRRRHTDDS